MKISFRKAEPKDINEVFYLSNLNSTRQYSINQNKILWEEHLSWYNHVLKSEKVILYVIYDESNKFLGQVRFSINLDCAEISISIVDELKGKGQSINILKKSQELIIKEKNINRIIAIINSENKPSIKLFKKAGYILEKSDKTYSKFVKNI